MIDLWQQMADLTKEKCQKSCRNMGACCSGEYCEFAAETMVKAGEKVPPMPFVVDGKCSIPPHYRPLCLLHQCDIASLGFAKGDPEWTNRYFKLREKLEDIGFDQESGL